jgi:competence protein ComFA
MCSDKIVSCYKEKKDILVWAVCGAGKTEITFDVIKKGLMDKRAICFAIPRIDIIYDVYNRLIEYFVGVKIGVLNSYEPICDAQIYVMTTNQLLKFKNCFSICIVDEVDAFPFCDNLKFDYAVKSSLTDDGIRVYLTSTPTESQKTELEESFILNRRWHGYDLPVPNLKFYDSILLNKLILPPFLISKLYRCKRQQLWFVSNREIAFRLAKRLSFFKRKVRYVHSLHKDRLGVVKSFKDNRIDVLITTTILERGVTFDDVDVVVLDSSSTLYTKAALIQIAGRVNRKPDFQGGEVLFCYEKKTDIIKESINEIINLNSMS